MFQSIVTNLISNAIKFTPQRGQINITTSLAGDMLQVDIADNGMGITDEDKSMLFRVDAQIVGKGTEGETGSGLGLILCKEFVEKNGGQIWLESEEGRGSTFYFTIKKAS